MSKEGNSIYHKLKDLLFEDKGNKLKNFQNFYALDDHDVVYTEFLDLCMQKAKEDHGIHIGEGKMGPNDLDPGGFMTGPSRYHMAKTIKVISELSKGRLYQFIYKKRNVWGQYE